MSKGLEALKDIKNKPFSWEKLKDSLDTIEKELKALEIIKEKKVNCLYIIVCKNIDEYNNIISIENDELTKEEYDLLKEVLL